MAACIMIAFLYTFIAGAVFAFKNSQIMQAELMNQRRAFAEQARTRLDMKLNVAFNYVNQLRLKQEILAYARETEMDYYVITNVFNELKANMNAFTNIGYQIDLVRQGLDLVITPYATMSREQYYGFMGFDEKTESWFEEFERSGALPSTAMVRYERDENTDLEGYGGPVPRGPLLTFVRHEVLVNGEGIIVVISFHENQFLPELGSPQEYYGLLYDGEWITSQRMKEGELAEGEEVLAGLQDNARYAEFKLEDRQMYAAKSSALGKLHYVYSVPVSPWSGNLGMLLRSVSLFYAGLLLLGILLSLLLTNKLYKPVRGAVGFFRGEDDAQPTDEFAFIRESAARIQEANDSLQEMLSHNRLPLRKKFMRDLLLGLLPAGQAEAGFKRHDLDWLSGPSVAVVLEFLEKKLGEEDYPLETMLEIKSHALRIVMEHLEAYGPGDSVELDHSHYAILLKEAGSGSLKKLLLEAVAGVEDRFDIRITAVTGQPVSSGDCLKESYQSAAGLLEQRLVHDKHPVITFEERGYSQGLGYYYPLDMERELTVCVLQGKPAEATELFDRIWEENASRSPASEETLQLFMYAVITTINRIFHHLNKPASEVFPEGLQFNQLLRGSGQPEELRRQLRSRLQQIAASIRERSREQDNSLGFQMMGYMHEHYRFDMSLTDMAAHFNLSPNYISQLIKEQTGESFKDYLSEYRIKRAKQIMDEHADMKINDVAGMVGWNNANTFIRAFKKHEGITPGQYRQGEQREE
jgi:AraC-like DNA-binding protein